MNFSILSEENKKKLADSSKIVSEFKQKKLEKEAQKNWDLFYKRNATNFFKDRHWTTAEFKELLGENSNVEVSMYKTENYSYKIHRELPCFIIGSSGNEVKKG